MWQNLIKLTQEFYLLTSVLKIRCLSALTVQQFMKYKSPHLQQSCNRIAKANFGHNLGPRTVLNLYQQAMIRRSVFMIHKTSCKNTFIK